ncbi:MAG: cobalamin-dependent protein [Steroidobacteraceae bacterium]|jgi:methanogenic corrinoid protein MtbC1|nr:cobalamin-dependent protein [Steroidobacteraceae bacterium]
MVDPARVETYLQVLLRGDRRQALEVVDAALAAGLAIDEVQEDIVRESQRRIGALWEQGVIGIAEEHMATAISRQALAHLHECALPALLKDERVLVACVEGEVHDLPARMVADLLDLAGYDVRFLGADLPTDSLPAMLARFRPQVLALSVTLPQNLRRVAPAVRRALASAPGLQVAVGGRAVNLHGRLPRIDAASPILAPDARALVHALDQRFGYAPSFGKAPLDA